MSWHEQLGLKQDPFELNPLEQKPFIAKRIEKEILYHIQAGNCLAICGKPGSGKTTHLLPIIKQFGGEKKVIYFDCRKLRSIDIGEALNGATSVRKLRQGMILLFDGIQTLTRYQADQIKHYYDLGYIRSIVVTSEDINRLPGGLQHRIGKRIIKIPEIPDTVIYAIIQNRTGEKILFTQKHIAKLFALTEKNPQELLLKCKDIYRTLAPPTYDIVETEDFQNGLSEYIKTIGELIHAKAMVQ